jgi:hypothetical protein
MKNSTIKTVMLLSAAVCGINAAAQKEYPKPEEMRAGMSEFWLPQPAIVTPGDIKTNSAPSDAIVLFDGKDLAEWESGKGGPAEWKVNTDGTFTIVPEKGDIRTKRKFENFQLHIEWSIPEGSTGTGQGRGNSGVFLQGKYEVQILDSYENETYSNGQAASIYKQARPLVNSMRKQGEWNVYDIIYSAPVFKEDGTYRIPPVVTVLHNGVVVQNHTTILGTTQYVGFPKVVKHDAEPIILQSHGNPIRFRNIWLREL